MINNTVKHLVHARSSKWETQSSKWAKGSLHKHQLITSNYLSYNPDLKKMCKQNKTECENPFWHVFNWIQNKEFTSCLTSSASSIFGNIWCDNMFETEATEDWKLWKCSKNTHLERIMERLSRSQAGTQRRSPLCEHMMDNRSYNMSSGSLC